MKYFLPSAVFLLALALVGCESDTVLQTTPVGLNPAVDVALLPDMPLADEGIRARRRMDIGQLDASMRVVSGGIGWTELDGDGQVKNLFESLGATLGVPDYITRTREDRTPSVVFEKFLGDASRSICSAMVGREMGGPTERVLMKHVSDSDDWESNPVAVEANMRYLLLRFHGVKLGPGDPALEPWLWLFRSSLHDGSEPPLAWHTLCVALFTHPDFYSY
jgi:hypothetical protein